MTLTTVSLSAKLAIHVLLFIPPAQELWTVGRKRFSGYLISILTLADISATQYIVHISSTVHRCL